MSQQESRFESNNLNSNGLPDKDLKLTRNSSCSDNSCSRGGCSTSINKLKPETTLDAHSKNNHRSQCSNMNNNNNNNNLIMNRNNFSSQMDKPLCNSTSIDSALSILASNERNLMQSTASYLNYPQNANLAYANYPWVNSNVSSVQSCLLLPTLNMQAPINYYSIPDQNNQMMVIFFY
jgi:hypothetical protein